MMSTILRVTWGNHASPSDEEVLYISDDPLAEGLSIYFHDYMDYARHFKNLYLKAKELSTGLARQPGFNDIKIHEVPFLDSLEHHILSFWMQILRDRLLVKNMLEKEQPSILQLSGRSIDYERITECKFDSGLFEYSAKLIANNFGIEVTGSQESQESKDKKERYGHLWAVGLADQLRSILRPAKKVGLPILLISNHASLKLGPAFVKKARDSGFEIVGTDIDFNSNISTIYSKVGRKVSPSRRTRIEKRLLQKFEQIPQETWNKIFDIQNDDYGVIARKVVGKCLQKYGWGELYRMALTEEFLKCYRPKALLVLYDHGISEAGIVTLAQKYGVKTITIQHGLICTEIPGYLPIKSDVFACWGESEKTTLISQGADPAQLSVTGFPGFDELWNRGKTEKKAIEKPLRVLIATQGVESSVEWYFALTPTAKIIRAIAEIVSDKKSFEFTIRLHPNEKLSPQTEELARKAEIKITKGIPLHRQFEDCDVVVTQFSTVGLEALFYGKPLVSLNWVSADEVIPFAREGAAERSYSPKDFLLTLKGAFTRQVEKKQRMDAFLSKYLTDDNATRSLLQFCAH